MKNTDIKTAAERADKYALYEECVQYPPEDREFIERTFQSCFERSPGVLREDFCGSAWLSSDWVRSHETRQAIGIDLDPEVLAWGREKHIDTLSVDEQLRIKLLREDVLTTTAQDVDVIAALNFSYWILKQRKTLLTYFTSAYNALSDHGLFVVDIYDGSDAPEVKEELREDEDYTYSWDQDSYNPLTGDLLTKIHFLFADGSEIRDAFVYDWRLWRTPEVVDLMYEAGFQDVQIHFREADDEGDLTNETVEVTEVEDDLVWLAYIVGVKQSA